MIQILVNFCSLGLCLKETVNNPLKQFLAVITKSYVHCFQRSRSAKSKGETTKLFVDQEFPANDSSIFKNKQLTKNVVWKRPSVSIKRHL